MIQGTHTFNSPKRRLSTCLFQKKSTSFSYSFKTLVSSQSVTRLKFEISYSTELYFLLDKSDVEISNKNMSTIMMKQFVTLIKRLIQLHRLGRTIKLKFNCKRSLGALNFSPRFVPSFLFPSTTAADRLSCNPGVNENKVRSNELLSAVLPLGLATNPYEINFSRPRDLSRGSLALLFHSDLWKSLQLHHVLRMSDRTFIYSTCLLEVSNKLKIKSV